MVLVNTLRYLVPPDRTTSDKFRTVAFAKQNVPIFQAIIGHVPIRHVDHFDLSEVEPPSLHVGNPQIRARVCAGTVGRRFLKPVGDSADRTQLDDGELRLSLLHMQR